MVMFTLFEFPPSAAQLTTAASLVTQPVSPTGINVVVPGNSVVQTPLTHASVTTVVPVSVAAMGVNVGGSPTLVFVTRTMTSTC